MDNHLRAKMLLMQVLMPPSPTTTSDTVPLVEQRQAAGGALQQEAMSLEALEELVRAQSAEILGEDIGLDGYFAAGHVDSLSAVELANSIGRAAAVPLPGESLVVPMYKQV